MIKPINNIFSAYKEVYANKWYFLITLITAAVLFSLNAVIRNYKLLFHDFTFSLLWSLIMGLGVTFTRWGLFSLMAISLGAAMVLSFSLYLIRRQTRSTAGIPGLLAALLAPACPACALNLFGMIGLGSVVAFLPFKGAELSLAGIIIVIISIVYVSGKVVAQTCEIER